MLESDWDAPFKYVKAELYEFISICRSSVYKWSTGFIL